jgi:hydroxyacylglutathione hydrolase
MGFKMSAIIDSLRIGPEKNFTYLIKCSETNKAVLIDPAFDFEKIQIWLKKFNSPYVTHFFATHGHWDHAGGFNEMLKIYPDAKVVAHEQEFQRLKELGVSLDLALKDGQIFKLGSVEIKVLHTPGHTSGGCCYIVGDQLFSGDTLFIGQCGRTDLEGGSDADLFLSLQKLKTLDQNLIVRPGHDYGSKPYAVLKSEIESNSTLQALSLKEFIALP